MQIDFSEQDLNTIQKTMFETGEELISYKISRYLNNIPKDNEKLIENIYSLAIENNLEIWQGNCTLAIFKHSDTSNDNFYIVDSCDLNSNTKLETGLKQLNDYLKYCVIQ